MATRGPRRVCEPERRRLPGRRHARCRQDHVRPGARSPGPRGAARRRRSSSSPDRSTSRPSGPTAAGRFGLHLDPTWSARDGGCPPTCTASSRPTSRWRRRPPALAGLSRDGLRGPRRDPPCGRRPFVGRRASRWRSTVRRARLALSGTPFRIRHPAIPFVRVPPRGRPARLRVRLRRGAGRRLASFGRSTSRGSTASWSGRAPDGEVTGRHVRRRPRRGTGRTSGCAPRCRSTASGCRPCSRVAHERLAELRREDPAPADWSSPSTRSTPGASPILARPHRVRPVVVTSDDPDASDRIAAFAASTDPGSWRCAWCPKASTSPGCASASSPRRRRPPMFFRQAVGRIVRWTPGVRPQRVPVHPRRSAAAAHAFEIAESRRHSSTARGSGARRAGELDERRHPGAEEQLSLFAALVLDRRSATTPAPRTTASTRRGRPPEPADSRASTIDLPPPRRYRGRGPRRRSPCPGSDVQRRGEKTRLRDPQRLARQPTSRAHHGPRPPRRLRGNATGSPGIARIDDATVGQLQRRAEQASRWLDAPESFTVGRAPAPAPRPAAPASPVIDLREGPASTDNYVSSDDPAPDRVAVGSRSRRVAPSARERRESSAS